MIENETITLNIGLDAQKMPQRITWEASGDENGANNEIKAFMLAIWSKVESQTLRMDLWTTEMRKDEMDKFFFETFMTMADTYQRANGDEKITDDIRRFAYKFGERTQIIKREER